jgi:hypothetical protein
MKRTDPREEKCSSGPHEQRHVFSRKPAEEELILASARVLIEPLIAERIKDLVGKVLDWDWVLDISTRNGVGPLLYRSLKTLAPFAVPPHIMERLQRNYYQNVAHNLALDDQLGTLLRSFQAAGIPAIPYKGPALASSAYGNIALRVFGDLDILIKKEDVQRAADLMISLGYSPDLQFTPDQLEAYVHDFNELPFTRPNKAMVELQWEIVPDHFGFPVEPLGLWEDQPEVETDESGKRTIPPEKLLLMLCVHGAKDSWGRLAWICDVAELLRKFSDLDWGALAKLARETGGLRMLYLGLHLAHELLEAPLPEGILQGISKDRTVAKTAQIIRERLFGRSDGNEGVLETCIFYIKMRERYRDKVRFLFRTFIRPVPGQWDQLGLEGPCARVSNVIRHVLMSVGYGLGLARQRLRDR